MFCVPKSQLEYWFELLLICWSIMFLNLFLYDKILFLIVRNSFLFLLLIIVSKYMAGWSNTHMSRTGVKIYKWGIGVQKDCAVCAHILSSPRYCSSKSTPPPPPPPPPPPHLLKSCNWLCFVTNVWNGRSRINWSYSSKIHSTAALAASPHLKEVYNNTWWWCILPDL